MKPFSATFWALEISTPRGFMAWTSATEMVDAVRMELNVAGLETVRSAVLANMLSICRKRSSFSVYKSSSAHGKSIHIRVSLHRKFVIEVVSLAAASHARSWFRFVYARSKHWQPNTSTSTLNSSHFVSLSHQHLEY